MPLVQKIEISNFLNGERGASGNLWRALWPHQVFDLGGLSAAMNITNGKGKSSMVMTVLALLTADRKALREVAAFAFAPKRHSHYTHVRIQVLVPSAASGGPDLLSMADGDAGGDPMVFGVYGNSGENGELRFYSYQGTIDDCPVAYTNNFTHTFVDNNTFRAQLDSAPKHFPVNRQEGTDRAWLDHVGTIFDMASLHQQLKYQKLRGGEGGHGYFEVYSPPGSDYSASVFYERLAPELLVEGMGELGEEDEHGIEDTIHAKASHLIQQKHKAEQKAEELRRSENTLHELEGLLESRSHLAEAQREYDRHREALSADFAAIKYVLIDKPLPGMPRIPDESMPLARAMVLQDGKWFLPDRAMAEFTGEPASEVNRRAQERNGLALGKVDRSQVVDFACHLDRQKQKGGHASQLYSRETALALLDLTTNFTRAWTKQTAIDTLNQAFDWVETQADANPGREIRKGLEKDLKDAETQRAKLKVEHTEHDKQWRALIEEQSKIGDQQRAFRAMQSSGLFSEEELADPAKTGQSVSAAAEVAHSVVSKHQGRMAKLQDVHADLEAFQREYPDQKPADIAASLQAALGEAEKTLSSTKQKRQDARAALANARGAHGRAGKARNAASTQLERFRETAPAAARFVSEFGDVSPEGLADRLKADLGKLTKRINAIKVEQAGYTDALSALRAFREGHGDIAPSEWLQARRNEWDRLGREIEAHKASLEEAQTRRVGLDKEVVVAGKVAREAAGVAGGEHVPLHAAIEAMRLDETRRERVLTLFSALLHTPVYASADEARDAAARLSDAGIEAPVFLRTELEDFCRTGQISTGAALAHTWLVGIRTRQVECLLDPRLVESEKAALDKQITDILKDIGTAEGERAEHSPDALAANLARDADKAIAGGFEALDAALATELAGLEKKQPDLDRRCSNEMIAVIQAAARHRQAFPGIGEDDLQAELAAAESEESTALAALQDAEAQEKQSDDAFDAAQDAVNEANRNALQIGRLQKLQAYIDAPEDNPAFMLAARDTLKALEENRRRAESRRHFQFDDAVAFLKQGSYYAQDIETKIKHHKDERDAIQDKLLPAIDARIEEIGEEIIGAASDERKIDRLAHEITRMYRAYAEWSEEFVPFGVDRILETPLGAQTIAIHDAESARERAELMVMMADELDYEQNTEGRDELNKAKANYAQKKTKFESAIEVALAKPDLALNDYMRLQLERAKDSPDVVEELYTGHKRNHENSAAANRIAQEHLEGEWTNISEWLTNFTRRLKKNFALLQKVFGPEIDEESGKILKSGFKIEGKVAEDADIKAVLDGVVAAIEKDEVARAGRSLTPSEDKKAKIDLRKKIRNEFYRSVIRETRIKVCMPSISAHPLPLQQKMASTGQAIAMALLWIVRMAEFTTKRWLSEQASSAAQRRRVRHTQFTIIDGAFSSLSDQALIKDALDSIGGTKGSFQLIITDHDENYRNNWDYFPSLIVAKEIGGRFMLAERQTRRTIDAGSLGLPAGSLGVMSLRAVPKASGGA